MPPPRPVPAGPRRSVPPHRPRRRSPAVERCGARCRPGEAGAAGRQGGGSAPVPEGRVRARFPFLPSPVPPPPPAPAGAASLSGAREERDGTGCPGRRRCREERAPAAPAARAALPVPGRAARPDARDPGPAAAGAALTPRCSLRPAPRAGSSGPWRGQTARAPKVRVRYRGQSRRASRGTRPRGTAWSGVSNLGGGGGGSSPAGGCFCSRAADGGGPVRWGKRLSLPNAGLGALWSKDAASQGNSCFRAVPFGSRR